MSVKSDFAQIYSQWEQSHDEQKAIANKIKADVKTIKTELTLNELHKMKVQDELDLHDYTVEEAVSLTRSFITNCYNKGLRKIRLITGKGLHSPNGMSVIRPEILILVKESRYVSEFNVNPKPCDGGSGAIIVYLKKS